MSRLDPGVSGEMVRFHKLRKLGEHSSGEKGGVELPRDHLAVAGLLDEDGNLVDQPQLAIAFDGEGTWTLKLVSGPEDAAELFGEPPGVEDAESGPLGSAD